jgi:hypothetical protein
MPTIDERAYSLSALEWIQRKLGVTVIAECNEWGVTIRALRDREEAHLASEVTWEEAVRAAREFVSSVEEIAQAEATVAALFSDDVTE